MRNGTAFTALSMFSLLVVFPQGIAAEKPLRSAFTPIDDKAASKPGVTVRRVLEGTHAFTFTVGE